MAKTPRAFSVALIATLVAFAVPARACEHHDRGGLVLNGQINTADFNGGVGGGDVDYGGG